MSYLVIDADATAYCATFAAALRTAAKLAGLSTDMVRRYVYGRTMRWSHPAYAYTVPSKYQSAVIEIRRAPPPLAAPFKTPATTQALTAKL